MYILPIVSIVPFFGDMLIFGKNTVFPGNVVRGVQVHGVFFQQGMFYRIVKNASCQTHQLLRGWSFHPIWDNHPFGICSAGLVTILSYMLLAGVFKPDFWTSDSSSTAAGFQLISANSMESSYVKWVYIVSNESIKSVNQSWSDHYHCKLPVICKHHSPLHRFGPNGPPKVTSTTQSPSAQNFRCRE